MIRIILAEDHTILRKGLRALLADTPNMEVVAEASNGLEAIELVAACQPDVVVMDISMPLLNGLEATRRIKNEHPQVKIIFLTMHGYEEYVFQGLRLGAEGYLVKRTAPEQLVSAIQAAYDGGIYLDPEISKKVVEQYLQNSDTGSPGTSFDALSPREREVLQLIAEGHNNQEIAILLHINEKTARAHRGNIMKKLDIYSTAGLALYALQKGIISID